MRNKTLLMSLTVLFLIYASGLSAQDAGLAEQYRQALSPQSIQPSPPAAQKTTRGIKGVMSESERNVVGSTQPSLTMHLEFRFNSDELTPQTMKYLDALGTALQDPQLRGYIYKVEGHTDNVGTDAYNLELSRKRAIAVTDYMVRTFGLERHQFDVHGFGKKSPVASNDMEEGRGQNRRVVIINTLRQFDAKTAERPDIIVNVKYSRAKEERELLEGETLTQRDNYAVEFTPRTSAHVYIYQVDAMGTVVTLFPNPEFSQSANTVEPGRLYRIPGFGKWLYLDDSKGKEHIVVIAQKGELKDPMKICRREIGTDGIALASAKAPARSGNAATTRGMGGTRQEAGTAKTAQAAVRPSAEVADIDMSKVFVWKLSFMHQ
jgi:outer membrane protein OmpA-like peptidoglycan-associated protein